MKSRPPPRHIGPRRGFGTFDAVRRDAEERLACGLKLDWDQILLDIAAIRVLAIKRPRA